MVRKLDRRTFLALVGATLLAPGAGTGATETETGTGTGTAHLRIEFVDGAVIPAGGLRLLLDTAGTGGDAARTALPDPIESDGTSRELIVPLPGPVPALASRRVVARLEGADGRLLARGTATLAPDGPTTVVLYETMY